jgi:hypothetical protein
MAVLRNAFPRAELMGIDDKSGRTLQPEPLLLPSHLPFFFGWAQKGRSKPTLISGDRGVRLFGAKTFDLTSEYATHQTLFLNRARGNGNAVFFQRLKPANALPPASIVLWADLLVEPVVQYQRNPDGSVLTNAAGVPQPVMNAGNPVTVPGVTVQWLRSELPKVNAAGVTITQTMIDDFQSGDTSIDVTPVENLIGQLAPVAGTRTNVVAGTTSTRYPIFEFEADNFGSWGNNIGLRLQALTRRTQPSANESAAIMNKSFPFSIQLVERDTNTALDRVIKTLRSDMLMEFMFKPGAYDNSTKAELNFGRIFKDNYTSDSNPIDPTYGPFNRFHVYTDLIQQIGVQALAAENAVDNSVAAGTENAFMVNLFDGRNLNGNHYKAIQVIGVQGGGLLLNAKATHLASGGSDGTITLANFDDLCNYELTNFGDTGYPLRSSALYPISSYWDSGFSVETKLAMLTPISRRKDIIVHLCDQDLQEPLNNGSEQASMIQYLYNAARMYPDSEVYGTPVCRVTVLKGCAELVSSTWRGVDGRMDVPYNLEFLDKVSKYMGAGTGIWDGNANFTRSPSNRITLFKNNNPDSLVISEDARSIDWSNGAIWVEPYDMRDAFIPAFQTVYDDDTSVLNSVKTVYACVELWKVMERVWRDLTGEDKYTNDQFIKKSNEMLVARTAGRFDDNYVIVPDTRFEPIDENNGYSWTCIVKIYANNMRTHGKMTIEAWRMSDLNIETAG